MVSLQRGLTRQEASLSWLDGSVGVHRSKGLCNLLDGTHAAMTLTVGAELTWLHTSRSKIELARGADGGRDPRAAPG